MGGAGVQGGLLFLQKTNFGGRGLFSEGKTNSEAGGAGEFVYPTKEQTLGGGVCFSYKKTNSGGEVCFSYEKQTLGVGVCLSYKKQTLGGEVCFSYKKQTLGEGFVFLQKTNSGGRGLFFLGKTHSKQTPRGDEQTRKMEVVLPTRRRAARNRFRGVKSEEKIKYFVVLCLN